MDATEKETGVLIPLWEIARDHGYDPNKARNTQHSWRRAATNLEAQGEIEMLWLWPWSPDRDIVPVRNQVPCRRGHLGDREGGREGCQACGAVTLQRLAAAVRHPKGRRAPRGPVRPGHDRHGPLDGWPTGAPASRWTTTRPGWPHRTKRSPLAAYT